MRRVVPRTAAKQFGGGEAGQDVGQDRVGELHAQQVRAPPRVRQWVQAQGRRVRGDLTRDLRQPLGHDGTRQSRSCSNAAIAIGTSSKLVRWPMS